MPSRARRRWVVAAGSFTMGLLAACGGQSPPPQQPGSQAGWQSQPQAAPAQPQAASSSDPYSYDQPATPTTAAPPPQQPAPPPAEPRPEAPLPSPPPPPAGPTRERAQQLREAADLLDKAEAARARDAKSYAEQLFSSAELIVGPEALVELAPRFREGAPPRVQTPLKKMSKDAPPQPIVEGDSEKDHPEPPKPKRGSVAGTLTLDGKPLTGDFGVVTLEPAGKKKRAVAFPTARVVEQRNRQFAPHVMVVPVGSVVSFPNFDPTFHNVFSTSDTKAFDLGLYRSGDSREITFDREGTVRLGCNLHANMSAYIVVVGAPHYTITDANGRFNFKSVAPGKYLVKAYSERSTRPMTKEIEIKPGKNEIALGGTADAPSGPLPDKFGVARAAKTP